QNVILVENFSGSQAEECEFVDLDAMKLVNGHAQFARETSITQIGQNLLQMWFVLKPDAIGHDLVKPKAKLRRSPADRNDELGIDKWLASGKTEAFDAILICIFEKADGNRYGQFVRPFNRHATVRTRQVALVRTGK